MGYQLKLIEKPHFLHAIVTGENTQENVSDYLSELQKHCMATKQDHVLIEERLEGPGLSTLEIFQIASRKSPEAVKVVKCIAFVDLNPEVGVEDNLFAETIAVNRGLNLKMFSTVEEAERWICS